MNSSDGDTVRQTKLPAVNESGLYALIFQSSGEEAKAFQRWVTGKLLPDIRKAAMEEPPERPPVLDGVDIEDVVPALRTFEG